MLRIGLCCRLMMLMMGSMKKRMMFAETQKLPLLGIAALADDDGGDDS